MVGVGEAVSAGNLLLRAYRTLLRRPDPVVQLRHIERVRTEIRTNLDRPTHEYAPEVMIVRVDKRHRYPEPDMRRLGLGASPWFKAEVKGAESDDLEVFSAIDHVTIKRGKARSVGHEAPGNRKVFVVGAIPYERIEYIDWSPDRAFGLPRFYCRYRRRGPYKTISLYEDHGSYFFPLSGIKYKPERFPVWKRIYYNWQFRRMDKRALRERFE
jgi:hypothetical protein